MKTTFFALLGCLTISAAFAQDNPKTNAQSAPSTSMAAISSGFVGRAGARLYLNGHSFRFGGANIDWLGLSSNTYYKPDTFYPSTFEVDDAFATVREMGGTVVRSHTLGISVGCPQCIEPDRGKFNQEALRHIDYVVKSAGEHGIRLIISLVDRSFDCANSTPSRTAFYYGNLCTFVYWRGSSNAEDFFSDATILNDFEHYIDLLLTRVNTYTGIPYKDDPTIMAWESCNQCGLNAGADKVVTWTKEIGEYIKRADSNHLFVDGSGLLRTGKSGTLDLKVVDIVANEYIPQWDAVVNQSGKLAVEQRTTPDEVKADAAVAASHGKAFIASAYGWDAANWKTPAALQSLLDEYLKDPNVAGDAFWDLEAHDSDHGYMPVHGPASPTAKSVEDDKIPGGDWWAFFYPGSATHWNTEQDMRTRGRMLRTHAYTMAGLAPAPAHVLPSAPLITYLQNGLVMWRGAASADKYSIQRALSEDGPWTTACDRCANDAGGGRWQDSEPGAAKNWYRVIPYSVDGDQGTASKPERRVKGATGKE